MSKVEPLSPEELQLKLAKQFPLNATCWSDATDEVRDMCREARILAAIQEDQAVDFRTLATPAQWNTQGIQGIVGFYGMLTKAKRKQFCSRFKGFFA